MRAMFANDDLHRPYGREPRSGLCPPRRPAAYELMQAARRAPGRTGARPDWMQTWMEPFTRTIDAAKKGHAVSSALERIAWNAELVRGNLGTAALHLKRESGRGLFVGA